MALSGYFYMALDRYVTEMGFVQKQTIVSVPLDIRDSSAKLKTRSLAMDLARMNRACALIMVPVSDWTHASVMLAMQEISAHT